MGIPVGEGGVWKNTEVKAGDTSLPYWMTGDDEKKVTLTADKDMVICLEINKEIAGQWHDLPTNKALKRWVKKQLRFPFQYLDPQRLHIIIDNGAISLLKHSFPTSIISDRRNSIRSRCSASVSSIKPILRILR